MSMAGNPAGNSTWSDFFSQRSLLRPDRSADVVGVPGCPVKLITGGKSNV